MALTMTARARWPVLEIAEAVSKMQTKPRRSIVFVWHTGEEAGLLGLELLHDQSDGAEAIHRRADQHRHDRTRA